MLFDINNAPDCIFITDISGRLIEVNESAIRITGYSRDNLLNLFISDILDLNSGMINSPPNLAEKEKIIGEAHIKRKDGTKCILLLNGVKQPENRFILFGKDITSSKKLEEDLIKSREFLNNIINTLPDPIFVKNEEHRWLLLNDAFCKFTGHNRDDLLFKTDYDFFPEDEANVFYEKDKIVLTSGLENENEELFTDASGVIHTISTKKSVFKNINEEKILVGIIRDITDRKKAEEDHIRLATAVEHAIEAIIVTDINGNIQYINPTFEAITGYRKDEIINQNTSILEPKLYKGTYKKILDTMTDKWRGHMVNIRKDGSSYEVEVSISSIKNTSEEIINYVFVERDLTNEARLEKHLRQSQKMEAIGTLAGGIAHDFNNILAIILGYAELAMKDIPKNSITKRKLKGIIKAGTRGKELVEQILAFSRQKEKERKPVQISFLIKELLTFLRASLPSTIEIRKKIQANSSLVFADPTQMHQVLMNLCTNAAHAMRKKGGTLEVGLRDLDIEADDIKEYPDLSPGTYIKLTVSDTGEGMTNNVMERIFEPFFTTKETGEGTGLGLAVVHGIIKSHGGAISVTSEEGKGSTFSVVLPRLDTETIIKEEFNSEIPSGKADILFIDDEEDIVYLEQEKLEALGYNVITKTNSMEALKFFKKHPDDFDVVITDMTMPGMTGIELAKDIIKIRKDMPVILCSGFSDLITKEHIKQAGIKKFLMKPISLKEFSEAINEVVKKSQ